MASNPMSYKDIIQPDDSIERAIKELDKLLESYKKFSGYIKTEATNMANSMDGMTGATEDQRNAILALEKEVEALKKKNDDLNKSIKEAKQARTQLTEAQKEANKITTLTEKVNSSVEGSYNRLSAQYSINKIALNQMSAAQRESTEEGRNLVEETKKIYDQMKSLQEITGNTSLNVGNYADASKGLVSILREKTQALAELEMQGKQNSEEYRTLVEDAGAVKDALGDAKSAIDRKASDTSTFDAILSGATTAGGAVSAFTGVMELAGVGTDNVAEAQKKLQSVIAITTGLQAMQNNLQKQSALMMGISDLKAKALAMGIEIKNSAEGKGIIVTKAATIAQRAFNLVANANPYVLLAMALITVVGAFVAFSSGSNKAEREQERLNGSLKSTNEMLAKLKASADFNIAIAEASGESSKAIQKLRRESAEANLAIADANNEAILSNINATKEQKEEALRISKEAWDALMKLNNDNTIAEIKMRKNAEKTAVDDMRNAQDARLDAMSEGGEKERNKIVAQYGRLIDDLKKRLKEDETLNEDSIKSINDTIIALNISRNNALNKIAKDEQKEQLAVTRKVEDEKVNAMADGVNKEKATLELKHNRAISDLQKYLDTEKNLTEEQKEVLRNVLVAKKQTLIDELAKLDSDANIRKMQSDKETMEAELNLLDENSTQWLAKKKSIIELEKQIALSLNNNKPKEEQIDPNLIIGGYDKQSKSVDNTKYQDTLALQALQQDTIVKNAEAERMSQRSLQLLKKQNEIEILRFRLENDKTLTNAQKENLKASIASATTELEGMKSEKKDIYDVMGLKLNDEQKDVINQSTQFALDAVNQMMAKKMELAEQAVEDRRRETDEAEKNLDRELEARNAGYASNVEGARKEYEEAKLLEEKAIKDKEKLQKQQALIDTATQVSSLITATANIWAGQGGTPIVGPALAVAATALMWGSFAASKIQAMKATKKYADGGLEFLNGGSHASGRDIPIGMTYDGKERRAEGGEALAIINKASTQKYRYSLPAIIKSINRGTFENSYLSFLDSASGSLSIVQQPQTINTETIEKHLEAIKTQGEHRFYNDAKGNLIEIKGNVKTIHRNGAV